MSSKIRNFETGATRNLDNNKFDYEGFLCPLVIEEFGAYMNSHRLQKDGTLREINAMHKKISEIINNTTPESRIKSEKQLY
jgi:hypothetical protein